MKQRLHLSDIKFSTLFSYEKALSLLSPISTIGNLNCSLIYKKEDNSLTLIVVDVSSIMRLSMGATLVSNDFEEDTLGLQIDFKKFLYAIGQYQDNYSKIEILVEKNDLKVNFTIKNGTDKISLPVWELPENKINEYSGMFSSIDTYEDEEYYSFSTSEEQDKNFLTNLNVCIKNGLSFIGKDENRNNAGAIYTNKFIVNDRRHAYIQNYLEPYTKYPELENTFIPMHKKNMRLFMETLNTEKPYNFSILKDYTRIFIKTEDFLGIFNNSVANNTPPTENDLENIRPTVKVYKTTVENLYKACSFFNGFYSSANEIKPLSLKINTDGELMLYLKDTGVAGFGDFSIEKILQSSEDCGITEELSGTIIYDSLRDYLAKENLMKDVEIYIEADKPAIYIKSSSSEVYLSILKG